MDLGPTDNPYRFYGLEAGGCTIGINLVNTQSEEFRTRPAKAALR